MSENKIFLPCHSSVKWSNPGDFLKAQFVIFRCQKYVKKGTWKLEQMNLSCAFKKCPASLHFTLLVITIYFWWIVKIIFLKTTFTWYFHLTIDFNLTIFGTTIYDCEMKAIETFNFLPRITNANSNLCKFLITYNIFHHDI